VLFRVRLVFVSEVRKALFHALGPYGPQGTEYAAVASRYLYAVELAKAGEVGRADAEFAALQKQVPEDYSLSVWRGYLAQVAATTP